MLTRVLGPVIQLQSVGKGTGSLIIIKQEHDKSGVRQQAVTRALYKVKEHVLIMQEREN